jgi:hypothetical protein
MIAALGTLPFLATLWLLTVLSARVLEESGAKIAAALKGEPQQVALVIGMRLRSRTRLASLTSAETRWRAAA